MTHLFSSLKLGMTQLLYSFLLYLKKSQKNSYCPESIMAKMGDFLGAVSVVKYPPSSRARSMLCFSVSRCYQASPYSYMKKPQVNYIKNGHQPPKRGGESIILFIDLAVFQDDLAYTIRCF